jgi:hypothetical protein
MVNKILFLLFGIAVMVSCTCSSGPKNDPGVFGGSDTTTNGAIPLDDESMKNLIQNLSSPVEVSALIKSIGTPFSQKYLASTKNVSNYNTGNSKAFNLGIFSADLGYLNMYSKTSMVLQYITAIRDLADGINVGQFFDFTTLKRLATNNENIDSLMYIAVHSYNRMDKYLRDSKRGNLSALMVTGVYIEGLYIMTQVYKEKKNAKLADNIGEQKNIFSELLLILKNYERDPYFAAIIKELETVKKEFEPIKIAIIKGEPETVEKDGRLLIVQNDKSVVTITEEQIQRIIAQTEIVRNKLIQ